MRIADHLSEDEKRHLNKLGSPKKKKRKKRKKENLSFRDWEDIMGMNRQTYYKKNGAWHGK